MFDYFWTDCLSLDQQNEQELSEQIPCMRDICSGAKHVFIFLGHQEGVEHSLEDVLKSRHDPLTTETLSRGYDPDSAEDDPLYNQLLSTRASALTIIALPLWRQV